MGEQPDDREHLLDCLARQVCRMRVIDVRQRFMYRWRKRHGDKSADELNLRVKEQLKKIHNAPV